MIENIIYLLTWPLLLIASLFAMAGILHFAGWLWDRWQWLKWFNRN